MLSFDDIWKDSNIHQKTYQQNPLFETLYIDLMVKHNGDESYEGIWDVIKQDSNEKSYKFERQLENEIIKNLTMKSSGQEYNDLWEIISGTNSFESYQIDSIFD